MNIRSTILIAAACRLLAPCAAAAADTSDDRIALSANGSTLTNSNGGGGGSVGWLHNFDADTIAGVAAEHQELSVAHWTFASVNGAMTLGSGGQRYTLYGDAHEGAGDDGNHAFHYHIETAGLIGTFAHQLSAQIEDKRLDVESTHGNLPKAGLTYLWNPHLQTGVSYAYSVSGNLGTRLTAARVDVFEAEVNFLVGGAYGQTSPALLGENFTLPARKLREIYAGLAKPLPRWRSEVTLVADYQDLPGGNGTSSMAALEIPGSRRFTLTLNYIFHIGHSSTAR